MLNVKLAHGSQAGNRAGQQQICNGLVLPVLAMLLPYIAVARRRGAAPHMLAEAAALQCCSIARLCKVVHPRAVQAGGRVGQEELAVGREQRDRQVRH